MSELKHPATLDAELRRTQIEMNGFGVSFGQAILVAAIGITLSFVLVGIIAIAGMRGSAPTMVLSRAAFAVTGQRVPGYVQ